MVPLHDALVEQARRADERDALPQVQREMPAKARRAKRGLYSR
jgi:hypothetical protein